MILETKTKILEVKVFNSDFKYGYIISKLLHTKPLQTIIDKIDDFSIIYDLNKDDCLSVNKFLNNLSMIITVFVNYFPYQPNIDWTIKSIFSTNMNLIEDIFLSNNTNDNYIEEKITKLIIYNFTNNVKYIDSLKILFKDNNISLNSLNSYSLNETNKILDLMSDLLFCKCYKYPTQIIFENIDEELEKISNYNKSKNTDKCRINYINKLNKQYNSICKNYYDKKKYIKYFK